MTESSRPSIPAAVRLIFEYEGDQVRLVHQQPVGVADLTREHAPGQHVEVRGAECQLLNGVSIRPGMTTSREVIPEDPNEPITRTDMPDARGAFTVVVPTTAEADHVAVVRIQPGDTEAGAFGGRSTSPVPGAPGDHRDCQLPAREGSRAMTTSDDTGPGHHAHFRLRSTKPCLQHRAARRGLHAAQQATFNTAAQDFVNALMATPPFDELSPAINVFRVNVASTDSGADDPVSAGGIRRDPGRDWVTAEPPAALAF